MDHTRHSDLFTASDLSVSLIGAGGIGAITALALSKMGVGYLSLFDADIVSDVNLATQLHKLVDIGNSKVDSLTDTLSLFADDTHISPYIEWVKDTTPLYGRIIISAVDSISARKDIWEAVKRSRAEWYIDARMAAEEYRQYVVNLREDLVWKNNWYEKFLSGEDDSTALNEVCTMKATFHTACAAAGHISAAVKGILVGELPARILTHNIRREVLFTL